MVRRQFKIQHSYDYNGNEIYISAIYIFNYNGKRIEKEVITNHFQYGEGCHIHIFKENDLELFTGKLPKDSPITFLSKFLKGEIKLNNICLADFKYGRIVLNENKSFRDVPEIMEQLKGEKYI